MYVANKVNMCKAPSGGLLWRVLADHLFKWSCYHTTT
jgi:hypothetical protein